MKRMHMVKALSYPALTGKYKMPIVKQMALPLANGRDATLPVEEKAQELEPI